MLDNFLNKKQISKIIKNNKCNIGLVNLFDDIVFSKFGFRLYENQKTASLFLMKNTIVEMHTGEGKTLSALLAAYLNKNLKNEKTFIVTANDFLSNRDYLNAKKVFSDTDIKVGHVGFNSSTEEKAFNYDSDIIFVTLNTLIFDYMRTLLYKKDIEIDSFLMRFFSEKNMSNFNIIIDEADMVLVDSSVTPFVVHGNTKLEEIDYYFANNVSKKLTIDKDFFIKEKEINLTDFGYDISIDGFCKMKDLKHDSLDEHDKAVYIDMIINALKANYLYFINDDYVIKNSKIVIINKDTGRTSSSFVGGGIHQALEAKELLPINVEKDILAYETVPYFLKRLKNISGLTGTVAHEKNEICNVYGLNYVKIPRNIKQNSKEHDFIYFHNEKDKYDYLLNEVILKSNGRPILIGAIKISTSEKISDFLKNNSVSHNLLNANKDSEESDVIANAGLLNSITISTNMSGRGVDILLGGEKNNYDSIEKWKSENSKINTLGGLIVVNFELNELERYDKQLSGRTGRQGDNGDVFYLVSKDDSIFDDIGIDLKTKNSFFFLKKNNKLFTFKKLDDMIRNFQKIKSSNKYESRLNLFKYDAVNAKERETFYWYRNMFLTHFENDKESLFVFVENIIRQYVKNSLIGVYNTNIDFSVKDSISKFLEHHSLHDSFINENILKYSDVYDFDFERDFDSLFDDVFTDYTKKLFNDFSEKDFNKSKYIILNIFDNCWKNHLNMLTRLRFSASYKAVGNITPLKIYADDSGISFDNVFDCINELIFRKFFIEKDYKFIKFEKIEELNKYYSNVFGVFSFKHAV